MLAYLTDLELEADRLRTQCQFVQQEALHAMQQIRLLCAGSVPLEDARARLADIEKIAALHTADLRDLPELYGHQPAHDRVITIGLRPFIEQVFRWQQRLLNAPDTVLRLELEIERLPWFPTRLRHILDNLISNAVAYRDNSKGETRLTLGVRALPSGFELRVADNGKGNPATQHVNTSDAPHRSTPAWVDNLEAGLAMVQLLVEQSGGTLTRERSGKLGSTFVAVLPRYDVDDFLERALAASPCEY